MRFRHIRTRNRHLLQASLFSAMTPCAYSLRRVANNSIISEFSRAASPIERTADPQRVPKKPPISSEKSCADSLRRVAKNCIITEFSRAASPIGRTAVPQRVPKKPPISSEKSCAYSLRRYAGYQPNFLR